MKPLLECGSTSTDIDVSSIQSSNGCYQVNNQPNISDRASRCERTLNIDTDNHIDCQIDDGPDSAAIINEMNIVEQMDLYRRYGQIEW